VLLAPLELERQKLWIARACEEKLSVADLRIELRTLERAEESEDEQAAETVPQATVVCPHCGHEVPVPAGTRAAGS
jgi:hypothetical protein